VVGYYVTYHGGVRRLAQIKLQISLNVKEYESLELERSKRGISWANLIREGLGFSKVERGQRVDMKKPEKYLDKVRKANGQLRVENFKLLGNDPHDDNFGC